MNDVSVYQAFKNAGFSHQQALSLSAEVGRENSFRPEVLFGVHPDPENKAYNLGMFSWQGDMGNKLHSYLSQRGLISRNGIKPGQAALNAMAEFAKLEMQASKKDSVQKFLRTPDISYQEASRILGKDFIKWRIDDPKYVASGAANRDAAYNNLVAKVGGATPLKPVLKFSGSTPKNINQSSVASALTSVLPDDPSLEPMVDTSVESKLLSPLQKAIQGDSGTLMQNSNDIGYMTWL